MLCRQKGQRGRPDVTCPEDQLRDGAAQKEKHRERAEHHRQAGDDNRRRTSVKEAVEADYQRTQTHKRCG